MPGRVVAWSVGWQGECSLTELYVGRVRFVPGMVATCPVGRLVVGMQSDGVVVGSGEVCAREGCCFASG